MTLCVAANLTYQLNAIVACFDFRVETETAGSNTGHKFRKISDNWAALLAGSTSRADRLLDHLEYEFKGKDVQQRDAYAQIQRAVASYHREQIEEYVQSVLAMPYSEFLASGKASLPDNLFLQVSQEIAALQFGCELIIFCVNCDSPLLFGVSRAGLVDQMRNFCAIGSGATNAEGWLHFREQSSFNNLGSTIQCVYEAKRFAEHAPGVGKTTRLLVFEGGVMKIPKDLGPLSKAWNVNGPRRPMKLIPFKDEDFAHFDYASQTKST